MARTVRDWGATLVASWLVVLVLVHGARARVSRSLASTDAVKVARVEVDGVRATIAPASGELVLESKDGRRTRRIVLSLMVDHVQRPLVASAHEVRQRGAEALVVDVPIDLGGDRVAATLEVSSDERTRSFKLVLRVALGARDDTHELALRLDADTEGASAFAPHRGVVHAGADVSTESLLIDDGRATLAVFSAGRELVATGGDGEGAPKAVAISTPRVRAEPEAAPRDEALRGHPAASSRSELHVRLLGSGSAAYGPLFEALGTATARVHGRVLGDGASRAYVVGATEDGRAAVRARTEPDGRFDVMVPRDVVLWVALLETSQASAPVRFPAGTPWELRLDVAPGGELDVTVADGDTGAPLTARVVIRGIEGTPDPSFGPEFRASGAGPLMDVADGQVRTPLPRGHYRVLATKGIEYSVDSRDVVVESGKTTSLALAPRHVVRTPGLVGCDLHVHARPSFDSKVSPEDRVLSLVAAGVDFAVPSEHNIVGDYGPALEGRALSEPLAHVPGVEVTTSAPRFGHFNAFPYPLGPPPRYRRTNASLLFSSIHKQHPLAIVQVNHPRLSRHIGYFSALNYDPRQGPPPSRVAMGFDAIEVYNGYDAGERDRVERILADYFALLDQGRRYVATGSSDSHRILYQWAGYPRTYARVADGHDGSPARAADVTAVVTALRAGRALVTSGPIVELSIGEARPGDSHPRGTGALVAHVRVRAAPWIDVSSFQILAGSHVVADREIASRPSVVGPVDTRPEELDASVTRFEGDVAIEVPEGALWVSLVVKGERRLDDVIPFMPIQPLAFTNPIWLTP